MELPDHVDGIGGQELHPHLPRRIDDLLALILPGRLAVDAERLAHHVVDRHQGKAEGEHRQHQDQQAGDQALEWHGVSHGDHPTVWEGVCGSRFI